MHCKLTLLQLQQRKGPKKEWSGNKREMKEKEELEKVAASPTVYVPHHSSHSKLHSVSFMSVRYEEWCAAAQAQVKRVITTHSIPKCNTSRSARSSSRTSPKFPPFSKVQCQIQCHSRDITPPSQITSPPPAILSMRVTIPLTPFSQQLLPSSTPNFERLNL